MENKTFKLHTGKEIPQIGLGTWKLGPNDIYPSLEAALRSGYRHIDCASIYGNEPDIGATLLKQAKIHNIDRESLFLTSKLWNNRQETVEEALNDSLNHLKTDYLDLYLIHWPIRWNKNKVFPTTNTDLIPYNTDHFLSLWRKLEQLVQKGKVRHIGVSNFNSNKLSMILNHCNIKPAVNQIEFHPYLQQKELINFCKRNQIVVTGYSPLGSPDHQKNVSTKRLLDDPVVLKIAQEYKTVASDILLRWAASKDICLIPKSSNPLRVEQNLISVSKTLAIGDLERIDLLDINLRYTDGRDWFFDNSIYNYDSVWLD